MKSSWNRLRLINVLAHKLHLDCISRGLYEGLFREPLEDSESKEVVARSNI